MRETRPCGFVRGVLGDRHPYRGSQPSWFEKSPPVVSLETRAEAQFWGVLAKWPLSVSAGPARFRSLLPV
jgi:hypothetical protein